MLDIAFCFPTSENTLCEEEIASLPFGKGEQNRLYSIKDSTAQNLSFSALKALLYILDAYDTQECPLTILRTKERKPYFSHLPYRFSLSHTKDISVAVLSSEPIGVDIEWLGRDCDVTRLSERFFTPSEHQGIIDADDKQFAFYSLWTKKEAYAKLTGDGLAGILKEDITAADFKQFLLSLDGKKAVLSVAFPKGSAPDKIRIHGKYNFLTLEEL